MNWFGVKIGTTVSAATTSTGQAGVGKYLDLKRPREPEPVAPSVNAPLEPPKKKKQAGFGDFSGW